MQNQKMNSFTIKMNLMNNFHSLLKNFKKKVEIYDKKCIFSIFMMLQRTNMIFNVIIIYLPF